MNKIDFFKTNVKGANLIDQAGGIAIQGNHIGQILINKSDKTVLIEIKQAATLQPIAYFEGHLLCKSADCEIIQSELDGGLFILNQDDDKPGKYQLRINNNRQGIIIKCSEIELIDYQQIRKPMDEYKDLYTGGLWGKFFKVTENE